jgi:V8-like Glu-specific endopeptidase
MHHRVGDDCNSKLWRQAWYDESGGGVCEVVGGKFHVVLGCSRKLVPLHVMRSKWLVSILALPQVLTSASSSAMAPWQVTSTPRPPVRRLRIRDLLTANVPRATSQNIFSVVDNHAFPYTAVVRIAYETNGHVKGQCTGAFVGNRMLLTAASCLYNQETQAFYDLSLIVIYDSNKRRLNATAEFAVVSSFYTLNVTTADVGLLQLISNVNYKDTYGYLGIDGSCGQQPVQEPAALLGYPST